MKRTIYYALFVIGFLGLFLWSETIDWTFFVEKAVSFLLLAYSGSRIQAEFPEERP